MGLDEVQIFGSGSQAFVAGDLGQILRIAAGRELMGHEGVAQVIDFGGFNAGGSEKPVDGGADITDQKGMAGFGDKEMGVSYRGADGQVVGCGGRSGTVEGDSAAGIVFQGADVNLVFPDIFHMQIGQLGNAHSGLKKQFYDGGHSNVQADGVAQRRVFGRSENAGRGDGVFGVSKKVGGIGGGEAVLIQKLEKSFEGIDLAADGFGGVGVA